MAVIFTGFIQALRLRRYRCPCCGCIIRLRPKGFFSRHQSAAATIRAALSARLDTGYWPRGCVSSRARNWLRALKRQALDDLIAAFDRLVNLGRVPVSRAV